MVRGEHLHEGKSFAPLFHLMAGGFNFLDVGMCSIRIFRPTSEVILILEIPRAIDVLLRDVELILKTHTKRERTLVAEGSMIVRDEKIVVFFRH